MNTAADPGWFHSSVAQATAAFVGVMGAYLVFRLSAYMNEWGSSRKHLTRAQFNWQQRTQWQVRRNIVDLGELPMLLREIETLRDERDEASFPFELWVVPIIALALGVVGVGYPLWELHAPTGSAKVSVFLVVGLVIVIAVGLVWLTALVDFTRWKGTPISPRVEYELGPREGDAPHWDYPI